MLDDHRDGTGSFEFEAASGVYTKLQCGSYIFVAVDYGFMDADYGKNRERDGEPIKALEPSLYVWATVMSRPAGDRAIVDAGLKALAFDSGPPLAPGHCDPTVNLYDWYVCVRDNRVEQVWPLTVRGAVY